LPFNSIVALLEVMPSGSAPPLVLPTREIYLDIFLVAILACRLYRK
jgi:hypothetical protein